MLNKLIKELHSLANPEKARLLTRFFKTGKGEYGEGDKFLGITVPEQRKIVAKHWKIISLPEVQELLKSEFHEVRLSALLVLVAKFENSSKQKNEFERKEIFDLYLKNTRRINNWDLVDVTAPRIVGSYLLDKNRSILYSLAKSSHLWDRRIAMVSTFAFIYNKQSDDALKIAGMLLKDRHDLMHKAVGWMLREVGKRCGEKLLLQFLNKHAKTMPRTALRYSIERLSREKKVNYMAL